MKIEEIIDKYFTGQNMSNVLRSDLIEHSKSQQEEIERLNNQIETLSKPIQECFECNNQNCTCDLSKENQKLREVLDSNEYISFIRKSLTNAECRRYWKQLLNK